MNRSRKTADLASHGNIFVDIANDRVGIGTTIPTDKLDLKGNLKLEDNWGYGNHIKFHHSTNTLNFPSASTANVAKLPKISFGDRTNNGNILGVGDFQIYHDFYNMHMRHKGANGNLVIGNENTAIQINGANGSGNPQASIRINAGATAGVKLYQAGALRFETVGYGVTVHGTTETQELNVTGITTFASTTQSTSTTTGAVQIAGGIGVQKNVNVGGHVDLTDSGRLLLGTGGDLQLFHNGSGSFIDAYTNNLQIRNDGTELIAEFKRNLSVDLYYDGTKRFETKTNGAQVNGTTLFIRGGTGEDSVLQFISNNSASYNDHYNFRVAATGAFALQTEVSANNYENLLTATQNGAVELYHNNTKTFQTTDFGAEVIFTSGSGNEAIFKVLHGNLSQGIGFGYNTILATGTNTNVDLRLESKGSGLIYAIDTLQAQAGVNVTGGNITLGDSGSASDDRLTFGAGNDLELFHSGSHSFILNNTGNLVISNMDPDEDNEIHLRARQNEQSIVCKNDGAVELYHDNAKKFETSSSGATVTGTLTATNEIISQDDIRIQSAYPRFYLTDTDSNDDFSLINNNGSFLIYNDTQNAFRLKIDGTTGQCAMNLRPTADSTFDLGTNTLRWANVYADTLYGDGSNLTGITQTTINNNADNRVITGSGTANTLEGESTLTYNGSVLHFSQSSDEKIILSGSTNPYIRFREGSTDKAYIQWNSNGNLQFVNQESGEYLRVGSGGNGLTYVHDGTTSTVWHAGNDGSGSGLDADTLDGISSASFVRSDASDTLTGGTYTLSSTTDQKIILSGSSNPYIRFQEGTTNRAYIQMHSNGSFYFVNQETSESLRIGSGASGLAFTHDGSERVVWHAGNDGSGSGLDADTVDGLHLGGTGNNGANQIVRTQGNGYIFSSFINTTSGDTGTGSDCTRFYASQDAYLRYIDLRSMRSVMNVSARSSAFSGREDHTTDQNYWIGSAGWGSSNFDTTIWDFGSCFFDTWSNPSGQPSGTSHWTGVQAMHYTNGSARYGMRITCGAGQPQLAYIQGRWNTTTNGWFKLWNAGNDGSGSGLDADTLDGQEGSYYKDVPSGTVMVFRQNSAPTGWTKSTSHNNKAMRIVSGNVGSGGSNGFTTALNSSRGTSGGSVSNHTLTTAQMPSHTHRGRAANHDVNSSASQGYPTGNQHNRHRTTDRANNQQMAAAAHDNTGSTNSHNHGFTNPSINLNVQYLDFIICTRS